MRKKYCAYIISHMLVYVSVMEIRLLEFCVLKIPPDDSELRRITFEWMSGRSAINRMIQKKFLNLPEKIAIYMRRRG